MNDHGEVHRTRATPEPDEDLLDRIAGESDTPLSPEGREAGRRARRWEAGFHGLPLALEDDPHTWPVLGLVTGGETVLESEASRPPGPEPGAVAAALEELVLTAGRRVGALPEVVCVRHEEIARELGARLAGRGVEVSAGPESLAVREQARGVAEAITGTPGSRFASQPPTWTAWGYPSEKIAELFRAAARFYRARPWDDLPEGPGFLATGPSGRRWACVVGGFLGTPPGLRLLPDPEDVMRMQEMVGGRGDSDLPGRDGGARLSLARRAAPGRPPRAG